MLPESEKLLGLRRNKFSSDSCFSLWINSSGRYHPLQPNLSSPSSHPAKTPTPHWRLTADFFTRKQDTQKGLLCIKSEIEVGEDQGLFKDHGELWWWKDLVLEGSNPGPSPASKVLGV